MKRAERSGADRPRLSRLFESLAGDVVLRFVSGRRTLDLGHGSDAVLDWVHKRAGGHVRVVDLDAFDFDSDDLGLGDLDEGQFDVVYSLQTFPHLGTSPDDAEANARRFLHQAARLCAPGGYVLIQIVNTRSLWGLLTGIRRPITLVSGDTIIERDGATLTRYDTLQRFVGLLPHTLELVDFRGLGIVTPSPRALSLPVIGRLVERAEWWLHDRSWPGAFGAHQIAVCRRGPNPSTRSAANEPADPGSKTAEPLGQPPTAVAPVEVVVKQPHDASHEGPVQSAVQHDAAPVPGK